MKRYRQEGLGELIPAQEYEPQGLQLAGPQQGHLALDGAVLGPLFDQPTKEEE